MWNLPWISRWPSCPAANPELSGSLLPWVSCGQVAKRSGWKGTFRSQEQPVQRLGEERSHKESQNWAEVLQLGCLLDSPRDLGKVPMLMLLPILTSRTAGQGADIHDPKCSHSWPGHREPANRRPRAEWEAWLWKACGRDCGAFHKCSDG